MLVEEKTERTLEMEGGPIAAGEAWRGNEGVWCEDMWRAAARLFLVRVVSIMLVVCGGDGITNPTMSRCEFALRWCAACTLTRGFSSCIQSLHYAFVPFSTFLPIQKLFMVILWYATYAYMHCWDHGNRL